MTAGTRPSEAPGHSEKVGVAPAREGLLVVVALLSFELLLRVGRVVCVLTQSCAGLVPWTLPPADGEAGR